MPMAIATDQSFCLEGLTAYAAAHGEAAPTVFNTVESLIAGLANHRFGLVVIDLALEDSQPIPSLRRVVELAGGAPVTVLDTRLNRRRRAEAIGAGLAGYLVKTMNRQMVWAGLDLVRAGMAYHVEAAAEAGRPDGPALTERQAQVLRLLGEGKSNREIAERLSITTPTVKLHVNQLLKRLGARNRTEAAIAGLQLLD